MLEPNFEYNYSKEINFLENTGRVPDIFSKKWLTFSWMLLDKNKKDRSRRCQYIQSFDSCGFVTVSCNGIYLRPRLAKIQAH